MYQKRCFKCRKKFPLTGFYRHRMMADGHLNKCKSCARRDVKVHRALNVDRVRAYDRQRARTPKRAEAMKAKNVRKVMHEGPKYAAAHNAVTRAVRSGKLIRPSKCDRCPATENIQAHHDDYTKKLVVSWLCPVCHAARHGELLRLHTVAHPKRALVGPKKKNSSRGSKRSRPRASSRSASLRHGFPARPRRASARKMSTGSSTR